MDALTWFGLIADCAMLAAFCKALDLLASSRRFEAWSRSGAGGSGGQAGALPASGEAGAALYSRTIRGANWARTGAAKLCHHPAMAWRLWFNCLRRRSQKNQSKGWDQFAALNMCFLYPEVPSSILGLAERRNAGNSREEPGAEKLHARICDGEAEWPGYSIDSRHRRGRKARLEKDLSVWRRWRGLADERHSPQTVRPFMPAASDESPMAERGLPRDREDPRAIGVGGRRDHRRAARRDRDLRLMSCRLFRCSAFGGRTWQDLPARRRHKQLAATHGRARNGQEIQPRPRALPASKIPPGFWA